jgi:glycosyltransferase involved in cell wall biosynthesis
MLELGPSKVGSLEVFARALAIALASHRWRVVFCFETCPPVSDYLRLDNVEIVSMGAQSSWRPPDLFPFWRLLRRYRPDTFLYAFNTILRPHPWVARLAGVRRIFFNDRSGRPVNYQARRRPWPNRLAGLLITLPVRRVLCVSNYVRRCVESERYVAPGRAVTVHNGVRVPDLSRQQECAASFRRRWGIRPNERVMLQVGWMDPIKGFEIVLQAAAQVLPTRPDTRLVLAGQGPYLDRYQALAEQLGIAGQTLFTGQVTDPAADGLFAAADICLLMSQCEESFGFVVAEAMAHAKPVIGSIAGGIPEQIDHGRTGLQVNRRDVTGLAAAMSQLLDDPSLCHRYGQAGRQRVLDYFNLDRMVSDYLRWLEITPRPDAPR